MKKLSKRDYSKSIEVLTKLGLCKNVPGYPGYKVDWFGNVYSGLVDGWRRKTPSAHLRYLAVSLSNNGVAKNWRVHRLVMLAFEGPNPLLVCHNNGNWRDNRFCNLRYDTPKGNFADRLLHGTYPWGENHNQTKLNDRQVRVIKWCFKNGMGKTAIARYFPISYYGVYSIVKGRTWKHIPNP